MKIILLGPPGAGKGTQAELIRVALNIPHIATGDMLRAAISKGDEFGLSIQATVAKGEYISDETIISLVKSRISEADCVNGFILDGFPRTPAQADALDHAGVKIDVVIQIQVPDEQIIKRLSGRLVHLKSGRIYNIYFHPPMNAGYDDETGEALEHRADDSEATVRSRLSVYHEKTEPLIAWYKHRVQNKGLTVISVDGTQDAQKVCNEILMRIKAAISSQ